MILLLLIPHPKKKYKYIIYLNNLSNSIILIVFVIFLNQLWQIYDNPNEDLVVYYGDFFRKENFEIKPLLLKIFTEEFTKNNSGNKIKNPLEFILLLQNELNIKPNNSTMLSVFLRQQGMDLFNQPNVKGWDGGKSWLTSQIYLQRNNASDLLCNGNSLNRKIFKNAPQIEEEIPVSSEKKAIQINFKIGSNKQIIQELCDRLLFQTDGHLQKDMEAILKYDFDANASNAQAGVLRLFNFITKTPEFQII